MTVASTDSRPKIACLGVRKVYPRAEHGDLVALERTDLLVDDEEFVCIVGPSGCGKSTLLFMIAGLIPPTEGRVEVDGRVVRGPHKSRGVVFQPDATFPWLDVRRNVEFGPSMAGLSAAEVRRVGQRYIDLVGLTDYASLLPRELSGGMKKRVDIARAIATEPDVLLMDEPFGALDAMTRQRLQDELLQLWERDRRTILFVTHDLEEAVYLGSRVAVMGREPNVIRSIMRIDLPHPRVPAMRTSAEFQAIRRELWDRFEASDFEAAVVEEGGTA
jgi:NitT/TauT family transport system ATP-binding protein